jgi:hypothetical protein
MMLIYFHFSYSAPFINTSQCYSGQPEFNIFFSLPFHVATTKKYNILFSRYNRYVTAVGQFKRDSHSLPIPGQIFPAAGAIFRTTGNF